MASSRARPKKSDPFERELLETVRTAVARSAAAALDTAALTAEPLKRPTKSGARATNENVALALSGGRDSMVLLDVLARLAATRGTGIRRVTAIHVHHGLSPNADAWRAHCEAECAARKVALVVQHVQVKRRGQGIEAAARDARYAALAATARIAGARMVLTAHHRDDRLETFLLQWMRGAGPDGLAAFPPARVFGVGDGADLQLLRPLINVGRPDIERYVELRNLRYVDDDSNDDTALARNAIRHQVLPHMDTLRAGFRVAAARSIDLVAEAAEAMRSIAAADLAACGEGAPDGMLRLDRLMALPASRQTGVLRRWLSAAGVQPPNRARLLETLDQARNKRSDTRMLVRIGDCEVRRYRGLLMLKPVVDSERDSLTLKWRGEEEVSLPGWGGVLKFSVVNGEGFEPAWLRELPLEVRRRGGGERFKPHPARPSKTLKRLFQDADVPEFERARLPLVWRAGELIFVGGLGADVRFTERDGDRVIIEWEPDPALIQSAI